MTDENSHPDWNARQRSMPRLAGEHERFWAAATLARGDFFHAAAGCD